MSTEAKKHSLHYVWFQNNPGPVNFSYSLNSNVHTIRQSSTDSVTYIKTRMYDNTRCVSPLYFLRCGRLVYCLKNLTLAKIDLKNKKKCFQTAVHFLYSVCIKVPDIMHKLYPYFDAVIAQNCIVLK